MEIMTIEVTWADHGPGPSCPAGAKCSDPPRPPLPDQSIPSPRKQRLSTQKVIYRYRYRPLKEQYGHV
jgi:hypothetical protein